MEHQVPNPARVDSASGRRTRSTSICTCSVRKPASSPWMSAITGTSRRSWTAPVPAPRYYFRLEGQDRPTPPPAFSPRACTARPRWSTPRSTGRTRTGADLPLEQYIIYELHVGTFTAEGTFDAVIPRLPYLEDLGVTAIELMPVAQFPGEPELGLRRRLPFCRPELLRRAGQARRGWSTPATARAWPWSWTWCTTTSGPEGNYLARLRSLLHRPLRTPWGQRSISTARQRRSAALLHRERALLDHRIPHRCAAAGRGPRHPRRVAPGRSCEELGEAVHEEAAAVGTGAFISLPKAT